MIKQLDFNTLPPHIRSKIEDMRDGLKLTAVSYRYPETEREVTNQTEIFKYIGDLILRTREGQQEFVIDEQNEKYIGYLIAYVNKWETIFNRYSAELTKIDGDLNEPIFLLGEKGVGKTLLMQITARFAEVMGLRDRTFINTSSSELLNHMRVNGDIDYYTYNIGRITPKPGNPYLSKPYSVCLHDLGVERDKESKQKIYGTDMSSVTNDFLMARYELYQNNGLMCHVTTNLGIREITSLYPPRVIDRFKQYNYITLTGDSRR